MEKYKNYNKKTMLFIIKMTCETIEDLHLCYGKYYKKDYNNLVDQVYYYRFILKGKAKMDKPANLINEMTFSNLF